MLKPVDYANLFNSCRITSDAKSLGVLSSVCDVAIENEDLYRAVENGTYNAYGIAIPWPLIAAIHFRESSQNFDCHLHNGDPLTERTVHVPKGRPVEGEPPFTWVESAVDAFENEWIPAAWDVPGCLEFLERYNGLGYQKHNVNSPYLWDFTDKYVSGLFVSDGVLDMSKKENRPGCVAILKTMAMKGVSLVFTGLGSQDRTIH